MTILDTFFIDFRTKNVTETQNDIKNLDKQISDLAAKGKKRTDQEQSDIKNLRKQRLEYTQDVRDQTRAVDGLGDSFGTLATKIVGVGAALFGLNSLKNGVLSAVDRNVGIGNQASVSGQRANDLRAIAAAIESEGGSAEGAAALIESMRRAATARGIPFTNPLGLLAQANKDVQGRSKQDQAFILEQRYGISDNATEVLLEKSVDEYQKIIELKKQSTALSEEDYATAKEFKGELTQIDQAWEKFYTKLGTATFPAVELLLGYVNHILDGLEAIIKIPGLFFEGGQAIGRAFNYGNSSFGSNRGGSSPTSVKSGSPSVSIAPKTENAAIDFWLSQGYTLNGAIGMAANEQAESSGDPNARNGGHYGLYQFDEKRRADILGALGIDVATASTSDQRRAAAWDAHRRDNDTKINSATSPESGAAIGNSYFEVSGEDPGRRMQIAHQLAMGYAGSAGNGGKSVTINSNGAINISTQATDPHEVGRVVEQVVSDHWNGLANDTNDGRYK